MTTVTNGPSNDTELLAPYDAVGWSAYARDPERLAAAVTAFYTTTGLVRSDTVGRYAYRRP